MFMHVFFMYICSWLINPDINIFNLKFQFHCVCIKKVLHENNSINLRILSEILKTFKMVLDTSLLSTQQYKVRIKGKVEQSREKNSALPYTSL